MKLTQRTGTPESTGGILHIVRSGISYFISVVNLFKTTDAVAFGGQAHGGSYTETFSASKTFNANNGNVQEMVVTGSTTIGITNEQAGTYIFRLEIDTATPPTITAGASFGTKLPNSSLDFINADNDVNILTLIVSKSGAKEYTISN
jgi:hypothetical protein